MIIFTNATETAQYNLEMCKVKELKTVFAL